MPSETDLAMRAQAPLAVAAPAAEQTTAALIRLALDKGQNPSELYRILSDERARQAKGEYAHALVQIQADCPEIKLTKRVGQAGGMVFDYAPLETVLEILRPVLAANGISVSWKGRTYVESGKTFYESTAVFTHVGGHESRGTFCAPVNEGQKGLQPDQCVARTATLCDRNALLRGLGLRAGVAESEREEPGEKITPEEYRSLNDALIEVGADKGRFCKHFGIIGVSDLRQSQLAEAYRLIEDKRKAAKV